MLPTPKTVTVDSLPARSRERLDWLDIARGLAIILVVLGHVERGLVEAHMADGAAWRWLDYALYTFHMPAFFLFAGLTAKFSLSRKRAAEFLTDKLWTIVYPYVLWSLILGFTMVGLSAMTNHKETLADLAAIGWAPIGPFWFLYVLFVYQVIGAVTSRSRGLLAVIATGSYVLAAVAPLPDMARNICHFMIFYAVGFLDLTPLLAVTGRYPVPLALLCLGGFAIVTPVSGIYDHTDYYALLALPSSIFGVGLLLAAGHARLPQRRGLALLGAASMTIYVLHILFAAGTRIALTLAHLPQNPWLYLLLCTAAGVLGPALAHQLLARRRLLAPLGLISWRRAGGAIRTA